MSDQGLCLKFHGVRGSVPTTHPASRGYGGNTPCLELALGPRRRLLLDCGSGLCSVESDLHAHPGAAEVRFDVLLTHFHWDHLMGLPFFGPLYDGGARFTFYGCGWGGSDLREILEGAIRPPWFPVALGDTPSSKTYRDLDDGALDFGDLRVTHARLQHPQGVTAYRLERDGRSVVFATDIERGDPESDARLGVLSSGADYLIHDSQYTPEEYDRQYRGWGHSTWKHAVEAARQAGAQRLILFHHDPTRTDEELDAIVAEAGRMFPAVEAAREGQILRI